MYNHNKAQQSKTRVHISWDILYLFNQRAVDINVWINNYVHLKKIRLIIRASISIYPCQKDKISIDQRSSYISSTADSWDFTIFVSLYLSLLCNVVSHWLSSYPEWSLKTFRSLIRLFAPLDPSILLFHNEYNPLHQQWHSTFTENISVLIFV